MYYKMLGEGQVQGSCLRVACTYCDKWHPAKLFSKTHGSEQDNVITDDLGPRGPVLTKGTRESRCLEWGYPFWVI